MDPRSTKKAWRGLARAALDDVREGRLKLRDLTGLTDAELGALAELADNLRRQGRHGEARAILALLLIQDPLSARGWRAIGELHRGQGEHAVALACQETAALLGGRDPESLRAEEASLHALGLGALGEELHAIAAAQAAAERRAS